VVTGNGVTYTPAITPVYDMTDDDFLANGAASPIVIRRKPTADAYNQVQVEFRNRANEYNLEPAEAKDLGNISTFGLRPREPISLHAICDKTVADKVTNTILQRTLYIRNEYEFSLGWRHCLLEPMDIVTLTHAPLGLDLFQVRIKEIEEDENGRLRVVAEEFPFGVATPAQIQTQVPSGYSVNFNVAAGDSKTPVIFEPPFSLSGQGIREVWLATSGDPGWGSAEVWVSTDGSTYKKAGVVNTPARHGALSADLPSTASNPDTANTLAVDLTVSRGELLSGTADDRDSLNTLCYVDGEYIAYQTATLTGAHRYSLTSLRRGAHGSTVKTHTASSKFVRLDGAIFKIPYSEADIGKTLFVKLRSINVFGSGAQELADTAAHAYTLVGQAEGVAVPPPDVDQFFVSRQPDGTRQFAWAINNPPADLTGFVIRFKLGLDNSWEELAPMHTGLLLASPFESNQLAAGSYTFGIKAVDMFGNESINPTFIEAVLGDPRLAGALEVFEEWVDGWPGTKTNCHVEPESGWLQPDETAASPWVRTWSGSKWINAPAGTISYERMVDVGLVTAFTPLVSVVADGTVTIDESHSDDNVTYTAFAPAGLTITARYVKLKITVSAAWPVLKSASTILSASPVSEDFEDLDTAALTGVYRIGVGDIRVPVTKPFAAIRKCDLTLQNVGPGWSWELIDKNLSPGPRLRIYNASNAPADAVVDITVRGL
jgi:hypothetical protein